MTFTETVTGQYNILSIVTINRRDSNATKLKDKMTYSHPSVGAPLSQDGFVIYNQL
jgi:hypothetical protein